MDDISTSYRHARAINLGRRGLFPAFQPEIEETKEALEQLEFEDV